MIKKIIKVLCVILVALLLVPGQAKAEEGETRKVVFHFYDVFTSDEMDDYTVTIKNDETGETIAEGDFGEYDFPVPGKYMITVTADGYYPCSIYFDTETDDISDFYLDMQTEGTTKVNIYTFDAETGDMIDSSIGGGAPYKIVNTETGEEMPLAKTYSYDYIFALLEPGEYEITQTKAPTNYELSDEVKTLVVDGELPVYSIDYSDTPEEIIDILSFHNKHKEASDGPGTITIKTILNDTGEEATGLHYFVEKLRIDGDTQYYDLFIEDTTGPVEDLEEGTYFVGLSGGNTIEIDGRYYGIDHYNSRTEAIISEYEKEVEVVFYLKAGDPALTIIDKKSVGTLYIGDAAFELNGNDVTEGTVNEPNTPFLIRFSGNVAAEHDADGVGGEGEYLLYYCYQDGDYYGPARMTAAIDVAPYEVGPKVDEYLMYLWRKNEYYLASGEGSTYEKGSGEDLVFVAKNTLDDSKTFDNFSYASVDGEFLPDVKVEEGSLILTLESDYLDTLDAGDHVLEIFFDGGFVKANFKVNEKAEEPEKEESKPAVQPASTGYQAPKTGVENYSVSRYALLAALGILVASKKR